MSDLTLSNPGWLLLLPLVCWLAIRFGQTYRRRSMWSRYCEPRLLTLLRSSSTAAGRNYLSILPAVILSVLVIALAGPAWQKQDHPLLESSTARVLILDLSQSMLVEDVKPNRFEHALMIARRLLISRFDGETALVVFADSAFTVSPLTRDATTLLEFIEALGPRTMPVEGNRFDLALQKADRLLAASISRSGQIIVITDGIDKFNLARHSAEESSRAGNNISVVAIGSEEGGPLKSEDGGLQRNANDEYILAKPDLQQLQTISQIGGGRFLHLGHSPIDISPLIGANPDSKHLQAITEDTKPVRMPENSGYWLVWLILPFSLLLFRKNTIWSLLIVFLAPAEQKLYAVEWNELWFNDEQRAFMAYQQGNYERIENLSKDPMLVGSAYYRLQKYTEADKAFSQKTTARLLYNRGNALARLGQLQQALNAYQQAMVLDPAMSEARFNHDLIGRFLIKTTETDAESSETDNGSSESEYPNKEFSGETRAGQVSQINELYDQSAQAGVGVSPGSTQGDLLAEEKGGEPDIQLKQFLRQLQQENPRLDPESVKLWTDNLYADPAELFKRKFLRDHLRDKRQQR